MNSDKFFEAVFCVSLPSVRSLVAYSQTEDVWQYDVFNSICCAEGELFSRTRLCAFDGLLFQVNGAFCGDAA